LQHLDDDASGHPPGLPGWPSPSGQLEQLRVARTRFRNDPDEEHDGAQLRDSAPGRGVLEYRVADPDVVIVDSEHLAGDLRGGHETGEALTLRRCAGRECERRQRDEPDRPVPSFIRWSWVEHLKRIAYLPVLGASR
jgi:hypothetical protein